MRKKFIPLVFSLIGLIMTSCSTAQDTILNNLEEREANVIVVFLESRGIDATKSPVKSSGGAGDTGAPKFNIGVPSKLAVEAMSILNQNGLPQRHGTTLLELFAKSGFMSTDREETIRYQAGLAQQLVNVILMIDGVIDANVQLSFPDITEDNFDQSVIKVPTAAVFVKHQGIFDDPNSHLIVKIKRLVSGSIQGLTLDNVTVVSDKSRFTDTSPAESLKDTTCAVGDEQVKIWSITMNKNSTGKFRVFFFFLTSIMILFALLLGWFIWKMYPTIRANGGIKKLFMPAPYTAPQVTDKSTEEESEKGE